MLWQSVPSVPWNTRPCVKYASPVGPIIVLPLRVYVPDLSVLLFDDDPVLKLLLLPLIVLAALDKQASGVDIREQATPAATAPKSAFSITRTPT